jgi:hypothetical protein
MSTISEKTNELFMASSLSDDDLGYPSEVSFVPGDQKWAGDVVWRNLSEGHPTVLVGEETELLLVPLRHGLIDRLRGRVPVNVGHRVHGHARPYVTSSTPGAPPRARDARARGFVGPEEQRHDCHDRGAASAARPKVPFKVPF